MLFKKKTPACGFEVIKEGNRDVLYINCSGCGYSPSLEDSPICMARTVDKLMQVPSASAVIFSQSKNYVYDYEQVQMLMEIAFLYNHFIKQKRMLSLETIQGSSVDLPAKHAVLQNIVLNLLRSDPVGAYVELKRLIRDEKIKLEKIQGMFEVDRQATYVELLVYIYNMLDKTKLISLAKPYLAGHIVGTRTIYKNLFRANITPNFILTKLMMQPPLDADELDVYSIGKDADVTIFSLPESIKNMYYLNPPEFKLSEDKYELIELARNVMIEHKPGKEEFTDPEKMRQTFLNIGRDLLLELANSKGIQINVDELEQLAEILVRYTVGFGLVEVLLQDPKIQDISINGPIGETPIFVVHQDYDECTTNIIPSREDGESWASKLRILSGRPLDEANPILDTELSVPGARARVAAISRPLTPVGVAYAFRRHRDKPWTLPLFIHAGFMSPLSAGLISFLIDGARTMLVAGTRGSGKTSLLGACMVELMRNHRIITVEDTLELPVDALRDLGYDIQPLKVRSALTSGGGEVPADEGIRTSLRMGDSSLIVGEVRSIEAKALYEAMRVGALANLVAGTIHGDSPYGVFDRVVNDLEVPRTSFKATDIILIANPVRSADGLHRWRRLTQITEVRKHWENDPLLEKGFVDLMKYHTKYDAIKPTDDLINGDSEILKSIAGSVKEWAGNWDAVWDNVLLRAKIKENLVNYAVKSGNLGLLEANFVISSNDAFHKISDSVKEETGILDSKQIYFQWNEWFKKSLSRRRVVA